MQPVSTKESSPVARNTNPLRARWPFDDLITSDGHRLTLAFSCTLRVLSEPAERKLFEETFLAQSNAITPAAIIAQFAPALRSAAAGAVIHSSVENAMSDQFKTQLIDTLRSTANTIAFSCGIEPLAPFDLEITSPTLQKERLEQMQRTAAERRSANRVEHFQRAADLLRQWESFRASTPSISPGKIIEQLSPADKGAMLEALQMASAGQAAQPHLWAVAGPYLAKIDVKSDPPQSQLFPLRPTAGPLRSVQIVDDRILIGARNGVFLVNPANPDQHEIYLDPELTTEYGFTRVTLCENEVLACHRDGGIVAWRIGEGDRPRWTLRPSALNGAAQQLIRAGNPQRLLFAVENQIFSLHTQTEQACRFTASSPIVAILAADDRLIIAAEDGTVSILDQQTFEKTSEVRPVGRLIRASLVPWLSSFRILLTTPDGPVYCIGADDQLVTQYTSAHIGARAVVGSTGKIAALSSDRQRLVLWNTWDGARPAGEIYLAGLAKHRVADIAFE